MDDATIRRINTRVIHFGKRSRVAVTFKRTNGLWHAHGALLPTPQRKIRVAREIVSSRLQRMAFVALSGKRVTQEDEE